MALPLLLLSSITSLWSGVGTVEQAEMSAGEVAFMAVIGSGIFAYSQSDPHWNEIRKKGHFDGPCDDGCARLYKVVTGEEMTPETRAAMEAVPAEKKEFARRMIASSHGWRGIVSRLRREQARREAAL